MLNVVTLSFDLEKNNDAILMQKGAYVPPIVAIIYKAVQPV